MIKEDPQNGLCLFHPRVNSTTKDIRTNTLETSGAKE